MSETSDKTILNTWIWSPNGHMASLTEGTVLIDYLFPRKRLIAANLATVTFLAAIFTLIMWLFLGVYPPPIPGFDMSQLAVIAKLLLLVSCIGSSVIIVLLWITNKILAAKLPQALRYRQCTSFADSGLTISYYGARPYRIMSREEGGRMPKSLATAINDVGDWLSGLHRGYGPTYRRSITKRIKKISYSWSDFASFSVQPNAIVLWRTSSPPQTPDSPSAQKDIAEALVIRMDPEQINYSVPVLQNYLDELPPCQAYVIPDPSFTTMPHSIPVKLLGMDLVGDCSQYMEELPLRIPHQWEEAPLDPLRPYVSEPLGPYNTQPEAPSKSMLCHSPASKPQRPAGLTAKDIENAYRHRF